MVVWCQYHHLSELDWRYEYSTAASFLARMSLPLFFNVLWQLFLLLLLLLLLIAFSFYWAVLSILTRKRLDIILLFFFNSTFKSVFGRCFQAPTKMYVGCSLLVRTSVRILLVLDRWSYQKFLNEMSSATARGVHFLVRDQGPARTGLLSNSVFGLVPGWTGRSGGSDRWIEIE